MDGDLFICEGCHRERPRSPLLPPGEQKYCSSDGCQQLRQNRWETNRLETDEAYAQKRRADKAKWRRAHSMADAAYRRQVRERRRGAAASVEEPLSGPVASPEKVEPTGGIVSGRYLMRQLDSVEAALQTVEVSVISVYGPRSIGQIPMASETDALARRGLASDAAREAGA